MIFEKKGKVQMLKEDGLAYQVLVLVIIIIIASAGVLINKVIGKNGMLNKVAEVETEFTKEDVLEKINYKVTQKFIELNNVAKENNQNISELYNRDVVIEFLKQNLIIIEIHDENGDFVEGVYDIDVSKLKEENENQNAGTYKLQRIEEKDMVVYYNENNEPEQIGELQIQQTI